MASQAQAPDTAAVPFTRGLIPAAAPDDRPWLREPDWRPDVNRVRTRVVRDGRGVRVLSVPELVYVDAYLEWQVPVEAARWAGYADPAAMGHVLLRRLKSVIEEEREARAKGAVMSPRELLELWSAWIRNAGEGGSPVAAKASELLARAQGILSDKLDVRVNRDELREMLESGGVSNARALLEAATRRDEAFEAEVITAETLEPAPVAGEIAPE